MIDRVADIRGLRTPRARGTVWPAAVDQQLEPGVTGKGIGADGSCAAGGVRPESAGPRTTQVAGPGLPVQPVQLVVIVLSVLLCIVAVGFDLPAGVHREGVSVTDG